MPGFDMILGMDVIQHLGGVTINEDGVWFGVDVCATGAGIPSAKQIGALPVVIEQLLQNAKLVIEDSDCHAKLPQNGWTVEWVWKDRPPALKIQIGCYKSTLMGERGTRFNAEVEWWIKEGILRPWEGREVSGVLPLMAVVQPTNGKVRPVLDCRELNNHIACHMGGEVIDLKQITNR